VLQCTTLKGDAPASWVASQLTHASTSWRHTTQVHLALLITFSSQLANENGATSGRARSSPDRQFSQLPPGAPLSNTCTSISTSPFCTTLTSQNHCSSIRSATDSKFCKVWEHYHPNNPTSLP
jgi:hypothetical protein